MALPTQKLGPPPSPKDPRFLQWLALLWAYVRASAKGITGVAQGGTGLSSVSQGDMLYGSAANTYALLSKSTTATRYLSNTGTSNNPAWAQVNLADGVTGTLPVGNGGTGAATLTGILQGNGTSAVTAISNSSTVGQVLRVSGAGTYAWGALDLDNSSAITGSLGVTNGGTNLTTIATNSVLVSNTADTLTVLTASTSQSIRRNATNTAWEAYTPTSGTVTSVGQTVSVGTSPTSNLSVSGSPITTSGTLALSITPWWVQKSSVDSGETLTIPVGYSVYFPVSFANRGNVINRGLLRVG